MLVADIASMRRWSAGLLLATAQPPSFADGIVCVVGGVLAASLGVAVVYDFRGYTSRLSVRLPKSRLFWSANAYRIMLGYGGIAYGVAFVGVGAYFVATRS